MKRFIRFLSLMMVLVLLVSVAAGCSKTPTGEPIDVTNTYTPLKGTQSDWIMSNPDRGYRTEMTVYLFDTFEHNPEYKDDPRAICVNDSEEDIRKSVDFLMRTYLLVENKITIAYISFNDCNTAEEIPQKYFDALDIYFEVCAARGVKVIWRHAYGLTTNKYIANKDDLEYLKAVCADQDTMVRHIKNQIGPYIGKHTDVIQKVSAGVIGNGEYTASFQYPPVDFNVITDAIVRYMCVPNNLQYSVRLPRYRAEVIEWWGKNHNGEEYPYADYIGFNNDCIYGENRTRGAYSACYQYNHDPHLCANGNKCYKLSENAIDEWQYVNENAAYFSQCGEMFTNNGMVVIAKIMAPGIDVIKEMAHHRHTTMSNWHTMGEKAEANTAANNVMIKWVETEYVTPEQLDSEGIIYDPNWFYDENGTEIARNPYEFIRDHLGYKLVADKATFKGEVGKGTTVSVDMSFKNYGFAAAFFLESGYAVLDSKYNVVSTVKAGEPNKWISLPADYYVEEKKGSVQNDIISYNLKADVTLPEESGKYYIAFYLKNGLEDYASLSNDIPFEEGFNILHEIEIK